MSFIQPSRVLPVHHVNPPSDSPYKQAFQTTPRSVTEAIHNKDEFAALWARINGEDKK